MHSGKESTWRRTWTVRRTSFDGPAHGAEEELEVDEEGAQIQDNKNVMTRLMENLADMKRLWFDDLVKQVLVARRVKLEDSAPL